VYCGPRTRVPLLPQTHDVKVQIQAKMGRGDFE
jgi:hypothetical protein